MVVVSSGGVRNTGDDAILRRCLERLARLGAPPPDVLLDGPDHESELPPVRMVGRLDECATSIDMRRYDAVLVSGGGWAADHFGPQLAYRAVVVERAAAAGCPVILSGQGVGPLDDPATCRVARRVLAPASAIGVRDPLSRKVVASLGIDVGRVTVTGDDALGLGVASSQEIDAFLRSIDLEPALPFILFHVRDANYSGGSDNLRPWGVAVDHLGADRRCAVVAMSVNDQFWAPEVETLRSLEAAAERESVWRIGDTTGRSELLAGLVARSRAVVAGSYHVALLALTAGTPTIFTVSSPYYATKAEGLRRLAQLPAEFVCADAVDGEELARRLAIVSADNHPARVLGKAAAAIDTWYATHLPSRS